MPYSERNVWTRLVPPLRGETCRAYFVAHARKLARPTSEDEDYEERIEDARSSFVASVQSLSRVDRPMLLAAGLVISDLAIQGRWLVRVVDTAIDELYIGDFLEDGMLLARHLKEAA